MNSQYQEDLRILKKAGKRIQTALILAAIAVSLYPAGIFFVLEQPFLKRPNEFNVLYMCVMLIEMVIWLLLLYYASTGKPASRKAMKAGVAAEGAFAIWLLVDMFKQMDFLIVYMAWFIALMIKIFALWQFISWLDHSYWGRIFYDHVLEVPKGYQPKPVVKQNRTAAPTRAAARQADLQARPKAASSSQVVVKARPAPDFQNSSAQSQAAQKPNKKQIPLSTRYPRMAIRILLVVIGEMVIFPGLVHMFQNAFVSIDNSQVIADNMEFTLCILTTIIWLLPVFFLYLKSPGCKKALLLAGAAQLLLVVIEIFWVWRDWQSAQEVYSTKVYLQFIMVEVARYAILAVGILPAFRLPEIQEDDDLDTPISTNEEDLDYEIEIEPDDSYDDEELEDDSTQNQ